MDLSDLLNEENILEGQKGFTQRGDSEHMLSFSSTRREISMNRSSIPKTSAVQKSLESLIAISRAQALSLYASSIATPSGPKGSRKEAQSEEGLLVEIESLRRLNKRLREKTRTFRYKPQQEKCTFVTISPISAEILGMRYILGIMGLYF